MPSVFKGDGMGNYIVHINFLKQKNFIFSFNFILFFYLLAVRQVRTILLNNGADMN